MKLVETDYTGIFDIEEEDDGLINIPKSVIRPQRPEILQEEVEEIPFAMSQVSLWRSIIDGLQNCICPSRDKERSIQSKNL